MPEPQYRTISEPISEVTAITNPVGTKNVAGTQVNPATEDTVAKQNPATAPTIYNVTMTNSGTEYSQALSANVKKLLIHTRDGTAFRLAFATGKVATPTEPYFTVPANVPYYEDNVLGASITLYFACGSAGKVVEIIAWS